MEPQPELIPFHHPDRFCLLVIADPTDRSVNVARHVSQEGGIVVEGRDIVYITTSDNSRNGAVIFQLRTEEDLRSTR